MSPFETASTLVFYDWTGDLNSEDWLNLAMGFFETLGSRVNDASYQQGESRVRTISPRSLRKISKRPDVRTMGMTELIAPFEDFSQYLTDAAFVARDRDKTAIFSHNAPAIDLDLFTSLTGQFATLCNFSYAIAFLRPLSLGPILFAYDISYNTGIETESYLREQKEMELWRDERMDMIVQKKLAPFRHLTGMLRDVYPMNVLTTPHVHREVLGHPLADWIASDARRGALREVADQVWTWVVPEDDIPEVRDALQAAGLLISRPPVR